MKTLWKLLVCFMLGFAICSCGDFHKEMKKKHRDYFKQCIEGRLFYIYSPWDLGAIGIVQVIGDDGKPVKCERD